MDKTNDKFMFPRKSDLRTIKISDVDIDLPDLKNLHESKASAVARWLIKFIESGLKSGKIQLNDVLPSKPDFAYKLGVSIGTMQNAFRKIEDMGYVESKQCIGTLVKDKTKPTSSFRKLTSKREIAAEAIKRYILSDGFKVGSQLPSSRTVSTIIGFSSNTTRLALDYLTGQGILKHKYRNSDENGWVVLTLDFETSSSVSSSKNAKTLVDMVVVDLENYITKNLKVGDRMPAHAQLAQSLKASIKTVHDALKVLIDKGVLLPKRGRYGTTVVKLPNSELSNVKPETSIFASASDTAFYHYEKTQNHIKKMIAQDYEVGDKLPSISELSKTLDISPNTIRKAFHNLADEGYLVFSRGRYGGTFVIDIPEVESQAFKWLAVNPQYAKNYNEISSD